MSALDAAVLRRLRDDVGGADALEGLVEAFLDESPRLAQELAGALARADAPRAQRAAHTLKSNAAAFGALELSALCRDAEERARAGDLGGLDARVPALAAELARVCSALQEELGASQEVE